MAGLTPAVKAATVVLLAGIVAALQVGKLPPALPVLQAQMGLSWTQAGFLLSMVQLAGMSLGLVVGLSADRWGLRRCMLVGLLALTLASLGGALAQSSDILLCFRAIEGLGFLLTTLPAPALIRRTVPDRLPTMMGLWGTYMPAGTALALLFGPFWIPYWGWPSWWCLFGALSALLAGAVLRWVPPDDLHHHARFQAADENAAGELQQASFAQRIGTTLRAPGPWLVAWTFAMYSGQWLAVVGFLPTIYAQAGLQGGQLGALTALAAAVNMLGNAASGRWLQKGVAPLVLLLCGFAAMALGSSLAFGAWSEAWPAGRYAGVLLFSMCGGLVPGTLFSLALRLAPNEGTVASTVGWMQQWSSLGQFAGPPLVAWGMGQVGGWQWTWLFTCACCAVGMLLSGAMARLLARGAITAVQGQRLPVKGMA